MKRKVLVVLAGFLSAAILAMPVDAQPVPNPSTVPSPSKDPCARPSRQGQEAAKTPSQTRKRQTSRANVRKANAPTGDSHKPRVDNHKGLRSLPSAKLRLQPRKPKEPSNLNRPKTDRTHRQKSANPGCP